MLRLKQKNNKVIKKLIAAFVAFIIVVSGGLAALKYWENKHYNEEEPGGTDILYTPVYSDIIRYDGKWYCENEDLETILVMGLDKYKDTEVTGNYVNPQQADFLALVAVNKVTKTVEAVQINRDTMTEVNILGVGGDEAGSKEMQIALSHTYGSGGVDSCINTVDAVSNFLYGVEIDHYVALTMDAVKIINDALGGVTVTLEDDFSSYNKKWTVGSEVKLTGEQALKFVRARSEMADSSNTRRMERQKQYLSSLASKAQSVYKEKGEEAFYNIILKISEYLTTDYSVNQMKEKSNEFSQYGFSGINQIKGEAVKGEEYMEFYPDEAELKTLVVKTFFTLQENK